MKSVMKHKSFLGTVKYDEQAQTLYGKVEGINDLVTYEGRDVDEIKAAFHEAVEDYIVLCRETGKEPGKAYKGSLNVRLPAQLHRQAAEKAVEMGISLNQLIKEAVEKEVGSTV